MANVLKKWVRRHRKRAAQAARAQSPRRRRQKRILKLILLLIVVAVAGMGNYIYNRWKVYTGYKILATSAREENASTKYIEVDGNLFRYNGEGASLEDYKGTVIWTYPYEMQDPIVDVCGSTIVVADQGGTSLAMFDADGQLGTAQTEKKIVKVCVSKQGAVAVILDGEDDTWINFYDAKGSLIAENQTRVDDPGYPLDIAVSEDGLLIMVAYQFVDGGETTSYVAYYNFGTAGKNQIDNIVSGYQYKGVVIPQTVYLDASTSVAFRDDGFSVFEGKQIPKEIVNVSVEQEIVSTFYDRENIGIVYEDSGKDQMYTMQVYDTKGKERFKKDLSIPYTDIRMSEGVIVMHNDSQVCVVDTRGVQKFNVNIAEGAIEDFFKIGRNKYALILEGAVGILKLK